MKKRSLKNLRLYLILDRDTVGYGNLLKAASDAIKGGVDLIQLRDKSGTAKEILNIASQLKILTQRHKVLLIINDRMDLALASDADGVHLGQDDIPVKLARKILKKKMVIGISCHSLNQALKAQKDGADYISIGPVFTTLTKPNYKPIGFESTSQIKKKVNLPFFAIGGINHKNLKELLKKRIRNVAICRAILCSQNIAESAKNIKKELNAR